MRVVEFLGAPGSGKTTLAREVVRTVSGAIDLEEAVRRGIGGHGDDGFARAAARLTRSSRSRLWNAAYARSTDRFAALTRFLESSPETLETVLAAQRQRADRDHGQEMVLGWVLNLMARYQLATGSSPADWLVIDEGFCQRGVALFAHGFDERDEPALTAYLGSIPQPEVVVLVETPPEICEARLDATGWSVRVGDQPEEDRRRFLTGAFAVTKRIADQRDSGTARMLRVDGTKPVPAAVSAIAATLET